MKAVSRILDAVCLFAKMIAALMLGVMLVVSLVEIGRRYLAGYSFPWADELIRYCIIGVAMLGGAAAFRRVGGLVAFDLILTHLKGPVRLALELSINTISLLFSAFMFRNAVQTLTTPSIVKQISIGLRVSMFWPYLPIAVGLGLIVIFSVERYFKIIGEYRSQRNAPPAGTEGGAGA